LVAKQAGQAAGGFAGGFFNNPGVVATVGIVAAIGLGLLFFQNDIRRFFGTTIPEAIGSIGDIQLPSINFPDITLPEITFPSLPDITFPDFNISLPSLDELPGVPEPFVEPERMDVPFDVPGREDFPPIDVVPDVTGGRGERLREVVTEIPIGTQEGRGSIIRTLMEIPFAVANVEESQMEFQERAGAFAEALPEVTASTSLPGGDIIFGRQLSRESEDFEDVLAAEARRSETIFAGLFGNVQNPEFGA